MLSRFVIAFLPGSKGLLILWLQSLSTVILQPKKIKSVTASTFSPSFCHEVMGLDAIIFVFWMLSFKPAFSLSSFTFNKRLFSYSLLSAIKWYNLHTWDCWYFSWQSWFQLVSLPVQHLVTMYSAYKLSRVTIYSRHTPFPIWNQSVVPCPVLSIASCPDTGFSGSR